MVYSPCVRDLLVTASRDSDLIAIGIFLCLLCPMLSKGLRSGFSCTSSSHGPLLRSVHGVTHVPITPANDPLSFLCDSARMKTPTPGFSQQVTRVCDIWHVAVPMRIHLVDRVRFPCSTRLHFPPHYPSNRHVHTQPPGLEKSPSPQVAFP